jgi:hypothetical protein
MHESYLRMAVSGPPDGAANTLRHSATKRIRGTTKRKRYHQSRKSQAGSRYISPRTTGLGRRQPTKSANSSITAITLASTTQLPHAVTD